MYRYNSKKSSRKYHIATQKGTLCKYENGGFLSKLDEWSDEIPEGREFCSICSQQSAKRKRRDESKPIAPNPHGISNRDFYQSWEWAKVRFETIKRYGAVCMCCGSEWNIVVDHVKPRRFHPELELDQENLQVLCRQCNRGKSFDDETDFRPKSKEAQELIELQIMHEGTERLH